MNQAVYTAQVSVYFSDDSYTEVFIYGFIFVFVLAMLIIFKQVWRARVDRLVKGTRTPFAMSPSDLDKMKERGELTQEELVKIRQSLARKMVERAEEEEREKAERDSFGPKPKAKPSLIAPKATQKVEVNEPTPPPPPVEAPSAPSSSLPPHLISLVGRNEIELEEMVQAGFLSDEDFRSILQAKESP